MQQDYTIDQVAEIIQVHRKTVEAWIQSGELEAYYLSRGKQRYRVTPAALDKFRAGRPVKPRPEESQKQGDGDRVRVA